MPVLAPQVPRFTADQAAGLAFDLYGIEASARELVSDRDQNFHLRPRSGDEYVLKLANASEKREVLEAQNAAMHHLASTDPTIGCPRVHQTSSGADIAVVEGLEGQSYLVRLLSHLPGTNLAAVRPHRPGLLRDLGRFLGRLDRALETFSHPGAKRDLRWDLRHASSVVRGNLEYIEDPERRALLERFVGQFESTVAPHTAQLRSSVIHNDGLAGSTL